MTTITSNIYQIFVPSQIEETKKVTGTDSYGSKIYQPEKTSTVSDGKISTFQQLNHFLTVINKDKVQNYLEMFPEILPFIMDASKEISLNLNEDTKIFLDFDEEINTGYPLLVVRQKTYQEDLLDIILEIGYKFIDLTKNLQGKFRIITDYKSI